MSISNTFFGNKAPQARNGHMNRQQQNEGNVTTALDASAQPLSLQQLLRNADLLQYSDKLRSVLKLRHAGDLAYTEQRDLTEIGMSRPEQKRLRQEYAKFFPPTQSSFVVKLRKAFGRDGKSATATTSTELSLTDDHQQHIIPSDSVELCRELGRGEFGVCFQGSWTLPRGDTIQVAAKRIVPDKLRSNPAQFLQEAGVMTRMRHDNVVRMYGVVLDTRSVMLVSELAPYGSLLECLQRPAWDEPFSVDTLCDFARQIACGMVYLSSQRLIHRDLAARNVLVSALTKVKISDFGLSRWLGVGEDYYRSDFSPSMKLPIAWCAPECINVLRFTSASDVYSYGVTLWEMFSYGKQPWQGLTGAQASCLSSTPLKSTKFQILHTIDTQRKYLDCPAACPSQFYALMLRCWAHDPDQRPHFEEIEREIPDSLMPQLLCAATDSRNGRAEELQFSKGETIILLDRKGPEVSPDNSIAADPNDPPLWRGALRNGQTGYFRPSDTVAHLNAENPTSALNVKLVQANQKPPKDTKESKWTKTTDKEKKKLLISEPQGDLRHTCHVGLDGKVFGLIHVNKSELTKNLPPLIGLSDPASLTLHTSQSGMSASASTSPAAKSTTTIGSSTGSTCSSTTIQQRPQRPPVSPQSSISPTLASVRQLGQPKQDTIIQNGYDIPQRMPKAFHVQAPALPPKPAARIKPQRSLATDVSGNTSPPPKPPSIAHRTQSLPKHGTSTNSSSLLTSSSNSSGDLCRPKSITVESGFCVDSKASTEPMDNMSRSFHDSSQLLDEVLTNLQQDISDFSFSTINDFSDTRPLIKPEKKRDADPSTTPIHIRPMNNGENDRLTKRMSDEHKKAARSLAKEFQQFQRLSSVDASKPKVEDDSDEVGVYTSQLNKANAAEEWTQEAQAAYKLLIECGDFLKATSPVSPTKNEDRLSSKSPNACVSSSTDTESTVRNMAPPLPPKKIQYINNTLVGNIELSELERPEIVDQRQSFHPRQVESTASKPAALPRRLPPKQNESEATGQFAPAVQRTALFASFPKDEVVKF
ncbi:Activated CDC42 kinase 1 [Aphelenchoides bicaudatus]|nr:Activated CDC42 kinase 1 [Aphelenchoides bicaudatus]